MSIAIVIHKFVPEAEREDGGWRDLNWIWLSVYVAGSEVARSRVRFKC